MDAKTKTHIIIRNEGGLFFIYCLNYPRANVTLGCALDKDLAMDMVREYTTDSKGRRIH